jgi:hypothetical protein
MNQDIFGRYIHKKKRSNYIELKPDGNYFLFEGSAGVTGTYAVEGTEIAILGADSTSRGKIQDGVITDSEGDKWIRAKDASEISDDPLASMTWLPPVLRRDDFPWELIEAAWIVIVFIVLMFTRP